MMHALLLVWAVISIESAQPLKTPELVPVEVAVVSENDLVRLRQGDRNAKQLEAAAKPAPPTPPVQKEAPKPTPPPPPAAAPPPPPPPAPPEAKVEPPKPEPPKEQEKVAALATPAPGPTPDEQKALEEKLKEAERLADAEAKARADAQEKARAEAEAKAKAEAEARAKAAAAAKAKAIAAAKAKAAADAKRKADEAKKFDANKIENILKNAPEEAPQKALIDKTPPKGAPQTAQNTNPAAKTKGPTAGAPEGRDTQLTASQASMLGTLMKQAVSRCWNINSGLEGVDKIVVRIEVKLNPDGTINGQPRVVNSAPGPLFADASNGAMRALLQCAPYANLPKDLYQGGWDFMVVTFDPQRMF
jgi:colicin import membrane protein